MLIGQFVETRGLGFGKIVDVSEESFYVEFFISPWKRIKKKFKANVNAIKRIPRQTRAFVETCGSWRMGTVSMEYRRDDGGYDYEIRFPNKVKIEVPGEEIYIRCLEPFDDPASILAHGIMETQFWHDRRESMHEQMLTQRNASRGLYAFLSSSIEFIPHQVEVARRVLEDPLQRYLLADEVGMGKTIEAGIILRQLLMTYQDDKVLVIVPDSLVAQWKTELESKFHSHEFGGRVIIVSQSSVSKSYIEKIFTENIGMTIVDESHNLIKYETPDWLDLAAKKSQRLLLLTATPSLADTKLLLRLIKLIDPDGYVSVSENEFQVRMKNRETLGIFLRGFRVDTSKILLKQRLEQLKRDFSDDPDALVIGASIEASLDKDDKLLLAKEISKLRAHISDVYRIHHRLIRMRRSDAVSWAFLPRGPAVEDQQEPDLSHIMQSWIEDDIYSSLAELMDEWRLWLSESFPVGHLDRGRVAFELIRAFDGLANSPKDLKVVLESFQGDLLSESFRTKFDVIFNLDTENNANSRLKKIARKIGTSLSQIRIDNPRPKLVIFYSSNTSRENLFDALSRDIGVFAVIKSEDIKGDIAKEFQFHPTAEVILCSPNDEEGLNFHYSDLLIHIDLPMSPGRIEQRIGRLDRFGRRTEFVPQRIFLPGSLDESFSYWDAWFDVLSLGFHIFNQSLSDMQFVLDDISHLLNEIFLESGAFGLRAAIPRIKEILLSERERLNNQYALDQVLQDEDGAQKFCQQLEDSECDESSLKKVGKEWIVDCLQFNMRPQGSTDIVKIEWDPVSTLIPTYYWSDIFKDSLITRKTFSRYNACIASQPLELLRVGSQFYSSIQKHFNWEDRGTAFGTFRYSDVDCKEPWFAFKLTFVVEVPIPLGIKEDQSASVRTRMDGYYPPQYKVLYVHSNLEVIKDISKINFLNERYKQDPVNNEKRDLNIGSRPELLYSLIDKSLFSNLCKKIKENAESFLKGEEGFRKNLSECISNAEVDLARRYRRINMRMKSIGKNLEDDKSYFNEIQMNQLLLDALQEPTIKLMSIGVFVIANDTSYART